MATNNKNIGFRIHHYDSLKHNQAIILLLGTLIVNSCGTGPWIIRKKLYEVYQEPVFKNDNNNKLRNDGIYILREHLQNDKKSKKFLDFQSNGYVVSGSILKNENLDIQQTFTLKDGQIFDHGMHWYKVSADSLIIEYYGANRNMMQTSVFHQRGLIHSDGSLELVFDDLPDKNYLYDFVEIDSVPNFENQESYIRQKWYLNNIHESRKHKTEIL